VVSEDPNEPKILAVFSAAVFAEPKTGCLTVSTGVAALTIVGVAVVVVDSPASGFCSVVFATGVEATSSVTGASLFTADIFGYVISEGLVMMVMAIEID